MFRLVFAVFVALGPAFAGCAQSSQVTIPRFLRTSIDSISQVELVRSLDSLLDHLSGPDMDNRFVEPAQLPETANLLDEIRGMDLIAPGRTDHYHCYLTNISGEDSGNCLVQFAYLKIVDSAPVLRASFRLLAHRVGNGFLFSSPLRQNAATWHVRRTGNFIFHYTDYPFDEQKIATYIRKAAEFDRKLDAPPSKMEFYCCRTLPEALQALGVDYKLDYGGSNGDMLTATLPGISLVVVGGTDASEFDLHDLWHDRLHATVPVTTINRPIDEGCAYLYGGSWGLSWEEIFRQFKDFTGDDKDWLAAFTENRNFAQPNMNHLYVDYVINALLVKKIEKEKGFPAVLAWLTCGKYQRDNDNYFEALDRIIGVNRSNFNVIVADLVAEGP